MNIVDIDSKLNRLELPSHSMERLVRLANTLSNEDLARLITLAAPRLSVYSGILNGVCITGDVSSAFTNGTTVQIDLVTTELDDLIEDEIFEYAIKKAGTD